MSDDPQITVVVCEPGKPNKTRSLDADSYLLFLGQRMELGSFAKYGNGTVQLTLKRTKGSDQ